MRSHMQQHDFPVPFLLMMVGLHALGPTLLLLPPGVAVSAALEDSSSSRVSSSVSSCVSFLLLLLCRLLLRMLDFLEQQSSCYSGNIEGPSWPPDSAWVPSAAAAAGASTAAASTDTGDSRQYLEPSYLSPYMAQTWRLLVALLLDPSEQQQQQLQQMLLEGPNKGLNVSLAAALERQRQLNVLNWLVEEGRPLLLSFLRRARLAAALQQQQQQLQQQQQQQARLLLRQQQLFLSCNARALAEAARTDGELRRFVALLHLVANGQVGLLPAAAAAAAETAARLLPLLTVSSDVIWLLLSPQGLASVHLLLRGGAFFPHLALAVAAHLQQPLGRQVSRLLLLLPLLLVQLLHLLLLLLLHLLLPRCRGCLLLCVSKKKSHKAWGRVSICSPTLCCCSCSTRTPCRPRRSRSHRRKSAGCTDCWRGPLLPLIPPRALAATAAAAIRFAVSQQKKRRTPRRLLLTAAACQQQ